MGFYFNIMTVKASCILMLIFFGSFKGLRLKYRREICQQESEQATDCVSKRDSELNIASIKRAETWKGVRFYSLILFPLIHSIPVTLLLRHFRIKIFAVSCLVAFIHADRDKTIWIYNQMILVLMLLCVVCLFVCLRASTYMRGTNAVRKRICIRCMH